MPNDKKYVELIWADKYDRLEKGVRPPDERHNLPFQVVETVNKPRQKDIEDGLFDADQVYPEKDYPKGYPKDWKNKLIWGDNKLVMSSLLKQGWAGKINLIYIDPPFFTGSDFSVKTTVHGEEVEKEPSIIEERAYKDTWSGGIATYLKYMHERLALMKDLLAEDGSIYVHLDWHVGHYVKVMMDELFGYDRMISQVIWQRVTTHSDTQGFGFNHDMILHYTKNDDYNWEPQYIPYDESYINSHYTQFDKNNRRFRWDNATATGSGPARKFFGKMIKPPDGTHWRWSQENIDKLIAEERIELTKKGMPQYKRYLDEMKGKVVQSVWTDIHPVNSQANEDTKYSTQKPEELLQRIINASSIPGDTVADFFCGSGTTLAVAEKLGRRWVGSDLSKFAIQVTRKRLLGVQDSK